MPDLIYEAQQTQRTQDILPFLQTPEDFTETQSLQRLTVFLTYSCNLDCPYCKTILRSAEEARHMPHKSLRYDLPQFKVLLQDLAPHPIAHLHFTGGEAVLIQELPEMIRYAKATGVAFVSLTSNGTLPPVRYQQLVEAGIDEIRISLDANQAELGMAMTQRQGAWEKTLLTLQFLAQESQKNPGFYLLVNTVVGLKNRQLLPQLLRFVLELGPPDDIKLITEVDVKNELGLFVEQPDILAQLQAILADYPAPQFPLLRRKIQTVFAAEAIGLSEIPADLDPRDWRCYIPLSERTVDRTYYYPCSVYLREGGNPLGELSDSLAMQRQKTVQFVKEGQCLQDPICQKYCLHCTREFNHAANRARQNL